MTQGDLVRVLFLDAESGAEIACTELPLERLPTTFDDGSATVRLDGSSWSVESAQPATTALIRASGALTLRVRAQDVDLSDILYSLPTICGRVPELDQTAAHAHADVDADPDGDAGAADRYVLHEDDWRQIELVDARLGDVVERQSGRIREIYARHARRGDGGRPAGFETVHVRDEPADPLPAGLPWADLERLLPDGDRPVSPVGFFGEPGVVPGSFAVPLGPFVLYGVVDDGAVVVCGLHLAPATADAQAASAVLARILRAHGLVLVDWCRAVTVTADDVPRYLAAALDPAGEPAPEEPGP